MQRNHSIDAFRGFAIIGMVFFTLTLRLSNNLPDLLRHNVWGSTHLGDFILPMFLFASGLSLAYYLQKREKEKRNLFIKNISKRFIKLVLVGISLSFFSAYGFLEMDEVMLSALLFVTCVVLSRFEWRVIFCIIFFINLSYFLLIVFDKVDIFIGHYLGGYPAALYYLPIMLTGFYVGRESVLNGLWCDKNKIMISATFLFFLFFIIFIPMNKLTATPSFILLSILFSFLVFSIINVIINSISSLKRLEYIGSKPLRYWLMMYILILIPLWFYAEFYKKKLPLDLHWYFGISISLALIIVLLGVSYLIDYITISN